MRPNSEMELNELESGIAPVSSAEDKASVEALKKEKKDLGIIDAEAGEKKEDKGEDPPKGEPAKKSDDQEPKEDDEEGDGSDGEGGKSKSRKTERPVKFIPIDQYNDRKTKWEDREKELQGEIEKLKVAPPESKKQEDIEERVKELAEELGAKPEHVKSIIDLARSGANNEDLDKRLKAIEDSVAAGKTKSAEDLDSEQFDHEWKGSALPALQEQFKEATEQQLADAKAVLDELSHSKKYHRYPIDYVLFKEAKVFGEILKTPKKKTLESGNPARGSQARPDETGERKPLDANSPTFAADMKKREEEWANESASEGLYVHRDGQRTKVG